ncbi:MAG: hypothetical protein V3S30_12385 [Thermoanaerobaculia bacterium]
MKQPKAVPNLPQPNAAVGFDPELEAALKAVLQIVYREHPLTPNQILILSSELQRVGLHRLVEGHIEQSKRRSK